MIDENQNKNEEGEESREAQGIIKKAIDSSSLIKLKMLLQGAPVGTDGQRYSQKRMVKIMNKIYERNVSDQIIGKYL